jgi:hypothetical protein
MSQGKRSDEWAASEMLALNAETIQDLSEGEAARAVGGILAPGGLELNRETIQDMVAGTPQNPPLYEATYAPSCACVQPATAAYACRVGP